MLVELIDLWSQLGLPGQLDTRSRYSRSHDPVIRVYDEAGNVIKTHEHAAISGSGDVSPARHKRNRELVNVGRKAAQRRSLRYILSDTYPFERMRDFAR